MEYARRVNEDARTPVAIRITRPYTTEDEFLTRELETLTRTSIVLVGAQPRPQGVVLRFEVALATGQPLVRGEGRVVAFKERVFEDAPGLTLRFTRLDSKSKALVDRAAAMRDARNRPSLPPPLPPVSKSVPPPLPVPARSEPDSEPASDPIDLDSTHAEAPQSKTRSERPTRPSAPPHAARPRTVPPPLPPSHAAPATPPVDLERTYAEAPASKARSVDPPTSDRDELLRRLRERGRALSDETVRSILDAAKR
jgi:hypothetical protein